MILLVVMLMVTIWWCHVVPVLVVILVVVVDPPNGGNQPWVEIPTEDIALLATVSARIFSSLLPPAGETTNPPPGTPFCLVSL